jgi:zinc transporter 1/2/3
MSFFDPTHVDLTAASQADVICYFQLAENEYNGYLPARISSIFVIGFISTVTYFPVIASKSKKPSWKIPPGLYIYLLASSAQVSSSLRLSSIYSIQPMKLSDPGAL